MRLILTLSVLLMANLLLFFVVDAQGQGIKSDKVILRLNNESLLTAIKKIEQQSVFRFFLSQRWCRASRSSYFKRRQPDDY